MDAVDSAGPGGEFLNVGVLLVTTIVAAKLISALIMPRSKKCLLPRVAAWPVLGGLVQFMKGPVGMLKEEYPKLGSMFTMNFLNQNIMGCLWLYCFHLAERFLNYLRYGVKIKIQRRWSRISASRRCISSMCQPSGPGRCLMWITRLGRSSSDYSLKRLQRSTPTKCLIRNF